VALPPRPAILDVGSGTGVSLFEAGRWFAPTAYLAGVDLSPGMVTVARARTAALGIPARFARGNAERLRYPEGRFDLVIANSVLHWIEDRRTAVAEMRRVLRPGGYLALICAVAPAFEEWFGLLDELLSAALGAGQPPAAPDLPTAAEVEGLVEASGFTVAHRTHETQVRPIEHPEPFVRLMSAVAPVWAGHLDPASQRRLEAAALARLSADPAGFVNTWSVLQMVAIRTDRGAGA
jgi:SAM-dependent methyltransferase